ncbi:hypothetical protein SLEP1_g27324 [Rubroshorea leprosula]|uniref:CCHC-type domain-containing protein n=1 Tax=Rubroshorea leprosula TaxID=152421 RepID=A0AAV5K1D6_9ROSI|nr:hypothetical protein SLEP1_g27324 [Rubroshorea leprosula]
MAMVEDNPSQDHGPKIPSVRLSPEITMRLRSNWQNTVIIKLLGKTINYKLLCARLGALWRTESEFDLIDLGLGFYTVKFASLDDRNRILTGGPWKIFGHYLAVQPWQPNFRPSHAKAPKTAIWVHFPELPTEYYQEPILRLLGNKVGRTIFVDETTLLATRGQYAKVCVEVNLAEPLASMVDFNDGVDSNSMFLTVAYDLNNVCFHCGEFGHKKDSCYYRQAQLVTETTQPITGIQQHHAHTRPTTSATLSEPYGPWMIINRKPRRPLTKSVQRKSAEITEPLMGNRFAVISNMEKESQERSDELMTVERISLNMAANDEVNLSLNDPKGDKLNMEVMPCESPSQEQPITQSPTPVGPSRSRPKASFKKKQKEKVTIGPVPKAPKHVAAKPYAPLTRKLSTPPPTVVNYVLEKGQEPCRVAQTCLRQPFSNNQPSVGISVDQSSLNLGENAEHGPGNIIAVSPTSNMAPQTDILTSGVNNSSFWRDCKEMLRVQKPDVICFLETKADSSSRAMQFMLHFGYDKQFQVPSSGFAGGLWLFWKSSIANIHVFSSSPQAIHCTVNNGFGDWLLSLVYVRPQCNYKEAFWADIESRSASISSSWVVMGDLNDVLSSDEVFPHRSSIFRRAQHLNEILDRCNLISEEALGCKYTWCRIQQGRVTLRERLDRALFNVQAKAEFQGAKLFNLPWTSSDHHPILLNIDTAASLVPHHKPRRFEAVWLTREEFPTVFSRAWTQHPTDIKQAISSTSDACIVWGKESFGDIFRKKRLLQARLVGLQNFPRYDYSLNLQTLEKKLLSDYQQVLFEEEVLWFQKSRVEWIASGDRNTTFYHLSTITRRCRNKVGALKIDGVWTEEPQILKNHVLNFFVHLFSRSSSTNPVPLASVSHPSIDASEHPTLIKPATEEEVRIALFSMKGLKSPGPDGIQALFYQRNWDTVKGTFLDFVNKALSNGYFDPDLARAHVVLIPKEHSLDTVQKFRPISLLNVAYKVLSKVLVNRLWPYLQELIGPQQSSFLSGRSTTDNIILTQEVVHSMQQLRGGRGAMVLKIDLHKAFDSVDWTFLRSVLQDFNLPTVLIELIMFSVSSVQLSVLWNGEPLPYFSPQRGLRQGDPLSPYLFIMVMEKLGLLIQKQKPHLVSWETVCQSKDAGGLGLRSAWESNKAFMAKLGWKLLNNASLPWCATFNSKYLKRDNLLNVEIAQKSSPTWKSILRCRDVLSLGTCWRVGMGDHINFWQDVWVGDSPLRSYIVGPISEEFLTMTVARAITPNKEWDVEMLMNWLPVEVVNEIRALPLSSQAPLEDAIYWVGTSDASRHELHPSTRIPWTYLFLSAIWLLWKDRNNFIFAHVQTPPQILCSQIFQHAFYTSLAPIHSVERPNRKLRWVQWRPPAEGMLKLNTDGSRLSGSGIASAGGLVRDSAGRWVHGFVANIGKATNFIAELWGLKEGLLLCLSLDIRKLEVELDSMTALQAVHAECLPNGLATALILDIKALVASFEFCLLSHTLREGNSAADFLASLGHSSPNGTTFLPRTQESGFVAMNPARGFVANPRAWVRHDEPSSWGRRDEPSSWGRHDEPCSWVRRDEPCSWVRNEARSVRSRRSQERGFATALQAQKNVSWFFQEGS